MHVIPSLSLLVLVQSAQLNCPNDAITDPISGLCYVFNSSPASFMAAESSCQQRDGHLSSISSAAQDSLISADGRNLNIYGSMWIGMTSLMSNDEKWQWIDGSLVTYTDWKENVAPQSEYPSSCVQMENSNGEWSSQDCSQMLPFVCSVPMSDGRTTAATTASTTTAVKKSTPTPIAAPCEPDWTMFNRSCFKVIHSPYAINMTAGIKICSSLSSHVASIHSQEENDFIYGMASGWNRQVAIGSQFVNSTYQWMDGTAWDYENWQPGEKFGDSDLMYTVMDSSLAGTGQWEDTFTDKASYFAICRKPSMT